MCGRAAYEYISRSIELAMAGELDAVATTPINKVSLHIAQVPYIGHTEIFADLTNTQDPLTMFEVKGMRVFSLTRHVSLRRACDMIKKGRILDYVHCRKAALRQLGAEDGTRSRLWRLGLFPVLWGPCFLFWIISIISLRYLVFITNLHRFL